MILQHSKLHHQQKTNPSRFAESFNRFMYVIAIIIPLMTIPQIITIWTNKSAQDVSLLTWSAYLFSALCWLIYSIIHKDRPLIINSILWVILETFVIAGIIIYG